MKSMLYVGATLMIGASIYGFVDYKNSSKETEFNHMYTEEKKITPEPVVATVVKEPVVEKVITKNNKKVVSSKKTSTKVKEEVAPALKPIAVEDKMVTGKTNLPEKTTVTVTPSKENFVVKAAKKKRKISSKLFSRAPLRDEIEMPIVEKVKKSDKKELKTDTKSSAGENKE